MKATPSNTSQEPLRAVLWNVELQIDKLVLKSFSQTCAKPHTHCKLFIQIIKRAIKSLLVRWKSGIAGKKVSSQVLDGAGHYQPRSGELGQAP